MKHLETFFVEYFVSFSVVAMSLNISFFYEITIFWVNLNSILKVKMEIMLHVTVNARIDFRCFRQQTEFIQTTDDKESIGLRYEWNFPRDILTKWMVKNSSLKTWVPLKLDEYWVCHLDDKNLYIELIVFTQENSYLFWTTTRKKSVFPLSVLSVCSFMHSLYIDVR